MSRAPPYSRSSQNPQNAQSSQNSPSPQDSFMITIDGSFGEGGGQILRTALGLALVTGKAFRIVKIRAGRRQPGLLRQHLTAANAASRIGCAEVTGASIGSTELTFAPQKILAGR